MEKYIGISLTNDIVIDKLFSVHYFEYSKDYKFTGEAHDFWEFVYVDKGEVICYADNECILLHQSEILFHKPGEWHNIHANGVVAPNLVIVSFSTKSPAMNFFNNKRLKIGNQQKRLISSIISESINAFSTPLGNPHTTKIEKKEDRQIGSEQLIRQYLCELFILLMRNNDSNQSSTLRAHTSATTFDAVTKFLNENINRQLTIEDICRFSGLSKASLQKIVHENTKMGTMQYFISLKIQLAKKYIRENSYNITQIAYELGYSSVHYFSRQFKKQTSMSPIEYAKSIKALEENKL